MTRSSNSSFLRVLAIILMTSATVSFLAVNDRTVSSAGPTRLVTLGQSFQSCKTRTLHRLTCSGKVRGLGTDGALFVKAQ